MFSPRAVPEKFFWHSYLPGKTYQRAFFTTIVAMARKWLKIQDVLAYASRHTAGYTCAACTPHRQSLISPHDDRG